MPQVATPEIVRASGFCIACDYRFTDELVARYPSAAVRGGYAYIELRHLQDEEESIAVGSDK